jgi:hypothetical protein
VTDTDLLAVGRRVEVTGEYAADSVSIDADSVESVDVLGTADMDSVELAGLVAEKISAREFRLNGVPVVSSEQAIYRRGDADDIAEDVRVEAEGQLIDGMLVADRIIFLDVAKLEADVSANDTGQSVITLHGLTDIPIRYNETTRVTGPVKSTAAIDATHHIKVIGRRRPPFETGTVVATHIITKKMSGNRVMIQGALEEDPPSNRTALILLDHRIDISGIPDAGFESPGGSGYEAFRASTRAGDIVSARGKRSGENVTWQRISVK